MVQHALYSWFLEDRTVGTKKKKKRNKLVDKDSVAVQISGTPG